MKTLLIFLATAAVAFGAQPTFPRVNTVPVAPSNSPIIFNATLSGTAFVGESQDGRMFYDTSPDTFNLSNAFHFTSIQIGSVLGFKGDSAFTGGLTVGFDGVLRYDTGLDRFNISNSFHQTSIGLSDGVRLQANLASNALLWIGAGSMLRTGIFGAGLSFDVATGELTASGGSSSGTNFAGLIITNSLKRQWVWQGANTNQVLDWSKTNYVIFQPSNTVTLSFANTPAAGQPVQILEVEIYNTNAVGVTAVFPSSVDWGSNASPVYLAGTNYYRFRFNGTNISGYSGQQLVTGSGETNVLSVSPALVTPMINGQTIASGTPIVTNSIMDRRITNYAHSTSIAINASTDVAAFVTNYTTANVSVLLTNAAVGASGSFTTKSDSSARTFSFFSDKLITMLSTNETLNSTQVVTTAGKKIKINWHVEQSTNGTTEIALWAKSQP